MSDGIQKHYRCKDCGVRLWKKARAKRHRVKTGHVTEVNWRATIAHAKHKARQSPGYLARLDQKIASEEGAWL